MISSAKRTTFLSENVKKVTQFKVLLLLFIIGLIYGSLLVGLNQMSNINQMFDITQQFTNIRSTQSLLYTFLGSFSTSFILVFILFLIGFCAIGQPVSIFMPFFHGLGLGLSVAYLYQQKGLQGILLVATLILPAQFLYTIALMLASRESLRFSNKIYRLISPHKYEQTITNDLKLYILRFIVILLMIAGSSIIDALSTFLFARFF